MVTSHVLYLGFLAALGAQRLFELRLSARNTRQALARGGVEVGRGHYPVMAVLHGTFFVACFAEVLWLRRPFPGAVGWAALALVAAGQGLRYWAILTLGPRWNTRIVFVPGQAPVTGGPYRWIRHPNYLGVVLELAAVPLVHGAWLTAVVYSAANLALLAVRIRAEERALGQTYAAAFGRRPRFFPHAHP